MEEEEEGEENEEDEKKWKGCVFKGAEGGYERIIRIRCLGDEKLDEEERRTGRKRRGRKAEIEMRRRKTRGFEED